MITYTAIILIVSFGVLIYESKHTFGDGVR